MNTRNTIQRSVILSAVRDLGCHATAEEIYDYIHETHPNISKGTVYRNLSKLAGENEIRKVEIPDGPDRFDHILYKHFHMQCSICGKIYDVRMKETFSINDRIQDTQDLAITDFDIIFRGICNKCKLIKQEDH